jgi:phosphate transport system substrate-binding protein
MSARYPAISGEEKREEDRRRSNMKRFGLKATVLAAAVALGSLAGCSRHEGPRQQVTVKGSDTMVHLVSSWAEAFMKANPGSEVSVTGGGSGTGIAALINGTTDLCASSRDMKESEKVEARAKGVEPGEVVVGLDGIAVIVNPANPANELTMEQVKKIFNGAVTSWRQLGGPDQPIVVLSRESSSGTYVFFKEHVLGKDDYTPAARLMPATSSIIQSVSTDTWAVGYVGLGYAAEAGAKVKMLRVKAKESSPAVTPSEATVKSGEYAIARPLFLYTRGEPVGAAQAFVEYSLSVEGQSIVRATGYVTVK